ncbi:hypothetical protein FRB91_002255, partial [Serendipita sp. 411]
MTALSYLESALSDVYTSRYLTLAAFTLCVYDWMLLFGDELELVGKSRWSLGKGLYYFSRIITPIGLTAALYQLIPEARPHLSRELYNFYVRMSFNGIELVNCQLLAPHAAPGCALQIQTSHRVDTLHWPSFGLDYHDRCSPERPDILCPLYSIHSTSGHLCHHPEGTDPFGNLLRATRVRDPLAFAHDLSRMGRIPFPTRRDGRSTLARSLS